MSDVDAQKEQDVLKRLASEDASEAFGKRSSLAGEAF